MKKSFRKNQKRFASSEKFPTFAVPNETGADQRMLRKLNNKIETMNCQTDVED